jgi:hypothetical protein
MGRGLAALVLLAACDGGGSRYAADELWLCRPGHRADACLEADLGATEVRPDGTLAPAPPAPPAADPRADCFYVYPTTDLRLQPGNQLDLADPTDELDALRMQAAPFRSVCRVFAPLYRQATLGSFDRADMARWSDVAYADVLEAFRLYVERESDGRPFVLMGHSQGAFHAERLLREVIEPDPALHRRLVVALLIGGFVTVPPGELVGGSFARTPLCTSEVETGCVIAYRSYAAEHPPAAEQPRIGPALDAACVNPGALAGGTARYGGAFLPLAASQAAFRVEPVVDLGIETPFALYRDFYTGECRTDAWGKHYLAVVTEPPAGDPRVQPIPLDSFFYIPTRLGLHILDFAFPMEELLRLVTLKSADL